MSSGRRRGWPERDRERVMRGERGVHAMRGGRGVRARSGRGLGVLLAASVLGISGSAAAQSSPRAPQSIPIGDANVTPVLDLRLRGELRHDPPDMGGRDPSNGLVGSRVRGAFAVLERARLGATVESGPLRGRLVLEDVRLWGTASSEGRLGPYETFLEVRSSAARPSWLRVGRQSIAWGEGLLLGAADFAPVGRALDALRGQLALGPIDLDGFASIVAPSQPQTPTFGNADVPWGSGAQLYGLRAAWPIDPWLKLELAGLARVARTGEGGSDFAIARGEGESYTATLRASGESGGWGYGAEGALQLGRAERVQGALGGAQRSAWAAFARVDKTFEATPLTPSVRLGGSYASGDGANGGAYTAFDPILPDVHMHFGAMNAFSWSNTMAAHLRAGIVPFADAALSVEYRYLRLADERGEWLNGYLQPIGRNVDGGEAELGHELDLLASFAPWPIFELRAGYAGILWGDGARTILAAQARGSFDAVTRTFAPADLAHYGFLQARLKLP